MSQHVLDRHGHAGQRASGALRDQAASTLRAARERALGRDVQEGADARRRAPRCARGARGSPPPPRASRRRTRRAISERREQLRRAHPPRTRGTRNSAVGGVGRRLERALAREARLRRRPRGALRRRAWLMGARRRCPGPGCDSAYARISSSWRANVSRSSRRERQASEARHVVDGLDRHACHRKATRLPASFRPQARVVGRNEADAVRVGGSNDRVSALPAAVVGAAGTLLHALRPRAGPR